EFLAPLQIQDMAYLLRNVLAMGRGSLDLAKKLLQEKNAPPPLPPSPGDTSPEWCKCNACRPMPNEIENVCCKRVTSVLQDFRHSTIFVYIGTSLRFASRLTATFGQMNSISPWRVSGKPPIDSLLCGGLANSAGAIGG
ncbi:hypothetical protein AWC38_SpisGene23763, partial [Stylophora pistillata]